MSPTPASLEPTADGRCRICRGALDATTQVCQSCGAAHGEGNRCPHCRSVAKTRPHAKLGRVCAVCGGPRLILPRMAPPTLAGELARARGAHRSTSILSALSGLGFGSATLALLGTLGLAGLFDPGAIAVGFGLSVAGLSGLVGWAGWRGRRQAERARDQALATARSLAAEELLDSGREATAAELAHTLGLPQAEVDRLSTALNVDPRFVSRIDNDGELVFSLDRAPRVRLADPLLEDGPSTFLSELGASVSEPRPEVELEPPKEHNAPTKFSG